MAKYAKHIDKVFEPESKIHLTAIIKPKEEYRVKIAFILQDMVYQTRKEECCELYESHQGLQDQDLFTLNEIWKSREDLDKHNERPYNKAFEGPASK